MIIKGDVNGDGRIDETDILLMTPIILGTLEPTEQQRISADVNGDGNINISDLIKIRNHILMETVINEVIEQ